MAAAVPTAGGSLLRPAAAAAPLPPRFPLAARCLNRGSSCGATVMALRTTASRRRRRGSLPSIRCSSSPSPSALTPELRAALDKVVAASKVVLFMKGSKELPQCGFSNTVVQILKQLGVPFDTVDVLESELLRQALKEYSAWPTFPQLYIDGDFFGGCDITLEAFQSGELQELLERTMCS